MQNLNAKPLNISVNQKIVIWYSVHLNFLSKVNIFAIKTCKPIVQMGCNFRRHLVFRLPQG